jgi:hypothetical protein
MQLLLAIALALVAAVRPSAAAPEPARRHLGESVGPVSLQSPAWRDLMGEPVLQGDTLAYNVVEVAAVWGRQTEATQLTRQLLVAHGRALAGTPPPATMAGLMAMPQDDGAMQAAWDAGLNHAWSAPQWLPALAADDLPPGSRAVPQAPGRWRLPDGRLAARLVLRNDAALRLALPGPPELSLQAGAFAVNLQCVVTSVASHWSTGEMASLACVSTAAVPAEAAAGLVAPLLRWRSQVPAPEAEASRRAWVALLTGRPSPSLQTLVERNAHCRDKLNCRQGRVATSEELEQSTQAALAHEKRVHEQRARDYERDRRRSAWWLLAALVGGFGIYALVARAIGPRAASTVIVLAAVMLSVWALMHVRGNGWGGLVLLILGVGAPILGLALALSYARLYRRFLAPK